jgi:hypothetical protein
VPTSSRTGGCTFAENPARNCASVLPVWSAAIDPRVLAVRAVQPVQGTARPFDATGIGVRLVTGRNVEHLLIDRGGIVRLDIIEGTVAAGPVALHFDLADDDRIESQVAAIRALRRTSRIGRRNVQLAGRLLALQAVDARDAGASLRETAEILLGAGDWPGDGDHRKSHVRRLIVAGRQMIRAGPAAVLGAH